MALKNKVDKSQYFYTYNKMRKRETEREREQKEKQMITDAAADRNISVIWWLGVWGSLFMLPGLYQSALTANNCTALGKCTYV